MQEQYESDHLKQELSSLRQRMAELEQALEPTPAPEPAAPAADAQAAPPKRPPDAPAVFPARCGRHQKGNRDSCYACGLPFQYEHE